MSHNIGKIDQIIRLLLAMILVILRLLHVFKGDWPDIIVVIATFLFLTGLRRCSPLYSVLGFGTCGLAKEDDDQKPVIKTKPYKW